MTNEQHTEPDVIPAAEAPILRVGAPVRTLRAKFPGTCQVKGDPIRLGDPILSVPRVDRRRGAYAHVECVDGEGVKLAEAAGVAPGSDALMAARQVFQDRAAGSDEAITALAAFELAEAARVEAGREAAERQAYVDALVERLWIESTTVGETRLVGPGTLVTEYTMTGIDDATRGELDASLREIARRSGKALYTMDRPGRDRVTFTFSEEIA